MRARLARLEAETEPAAQAGQTARKYQVPSALAASFFHLTRRHLAGKTAANALEERAFATLRKLSPDLRRVLTCALDSFDSLTTNERDKLFARDVLRGIDQPIDVNRLGQAFAEEILANIGVQFFEEAGCATQEHPGKVRTQPFPGGEFPPPQVRICRVNGLRTGNFAPSLALGDYTPDEIQQVCHVVLEGNRPSRSAKCRRPIVPARTWAALPATAGNRGRPGGAARGRELLECRYEGTAHRRGDVHDHQRPGRPGLRR